MNLTEELKIKVMNKNCISYEESLLLYNQPIDVLCESANDIRKHFCGNIFDICTIINAKSGLCSEDCKYCAQSMHYNTQCDTYPLLSLSEIYKNAEYNEKKGVLRYSIVTSGKNVSDLEIDKICEVVSLIKKDLKIKVCGSLGLLNENQYKKLYNCGLRRIHNNLETSENNFKNVCTTHSFNDKVNAICLAKSVGMSVCSGGIFGIGESINDRVELAFALKNLNINSIPINILNPIKGTPYEKLQSLNVKDVLRIVAVYRFILPNAYIRLAGGRGLLADKGKSCFLAGANAMITGDMLTTQGISIESDLIMIKELGFEVGL